MQWIKTNIKKIRLIAIGFVAFFVLFNINIFVTTGSFSITMSYTSYVHASWNVWDAMGSFVTPTPTLVSSAASGVAGGWFNDALWAVMQTFGKLSVAAAALFAYVVKPDVVKKILDAEIISVTWTIVRDMLNLVFILVLLFSAFATIFQVEKYHLRNILIRLIIMALLVNFSLPIAKVIIDFSNIIMYFFINQLFPATANGVGVEISALFGNSTNIADILVPKGELSGETSMYLFFGIIFTFFYAVSLLTIAGILVVRLVALAMLLVFSSVGFVAMILPSTQSFANSWWDNLFKYAFKGPILVFTLFFAIVFMSQIHEQSFSKESLVRITDESSKVSISADDGDYIANIAFFIIPLIILWMGIFASGMASDGASSWVTGMGKGALTGAGRKLKNGSKWSLRAGGRRIDHHVLKGRAASVSARWNNRGAKFDKDYKKRVSDRAEVKSTKKGSERDAVVMRHFSQAVSEAEKKLEHLSDSELKTKLSSSNKNEAAGAARILSSKGNLDIADLKGITSSKGFGNDISARKILGDIENNLRKNNKRGTLVAHAVKSGKTLTGESVADDKAALDAYLKVDAATLAQQDLDKLSSINVAIGQAHFDSIISNQHAAKAFAARASEEYHKNMQTSSPNYKKYT